jgi:hypothetical protein
MGAGEGAGEDERDGADGVCAARRRRHAVYAAAQDAVVGLIWRVQATGHAQRAIIVKSEP